MKTRRLTMAQALVVFLKQQYTVRDGVEQRLIPGIFGIFGHGNVAGLGQALEEYGGAGLPFYQPKNEQAMVHAATAFAKEKNRLQTMACTSSVGPGATNMITGAATATTNRLPVLLLPSDVFSNRLAGPVLQQLECVGAPDVSVNDCFKPVSKFWDRIHRPEQLLNSLPEAMRILTDPADMGAVTICLPEDVQAEAYDYPISFFEKRVHVVSRYRADAEALNAATQLISNAKSPIFIAGGGVHYSEAEQVLQQFSESTGIPVAMTQAGKGSLLDAHYQCLGAVGATGTLAANKIATQADVVLCVGTRLSDFTTASKSLFQHPNVKFIGINITGQDAVKHGAVSVVGDAKATLEELSGALVGYHVDQVFQDQVAAFKAEWETVLAEIVNPVYLDSDTPPNKVQRKLHQAEVIRVVNSQMDEQSVMVHAAGGLPGDCHKLWRNKSHRDYHSEYAFSCMGYEVAGALGIKIANPTKEVYAFVGDGSYLMLNHELLTSVQEGLKITLLLTENHGYQCIHNLQQGCGGESFGNEFRTRDSETNQLHGDFVAVDLAKNAESLGAKVFKVTDEASLSMALAAARKEKTSCVIHIPIEIGTKVPGYAWWDVPVSEVSEQPGIQAARSHYEQQKLSQRFYY